MSLSTVPEGTPAEAEAPEVRPTARRWIAFGLVVALVVGLVGVWFLRPGRAADIRSGTEVVTAEGLAARYGIDVTLIGVTAAGGMVDFRYQVVDPDKADQVVHDIDLFPKLINEETGATLILRSLPHSHSQRLDLGGNYFFLLPNAENAFTEGSQVTVVIGDVRLEHVIVKE